MTLDEFSERCRKLANDLHELQEEAEDDENDPQHVRIAILGCHLSYVMGQKLLDLMRL